MTCPRCSRDMGDEAVCMRCHRPASWGEPTQPVPAPMSEREQRARYAASQASKPARPARRRNR